MAFNCSIGLDTEYLDGLGHARNRIVVTMEMSNLRYEECHCRHTVATILDIRTIREIALFRAVTMLRLCEVFCSAALLVATCVVLSNKERYGDISTFVPNHISFTKTAL